MAVLIYRLNHSWSHCFGYNVCFYFSVQGCMYSCLARAQEKECNCTEGKYRTVSGICSETSDGNAMPLFRFTIGLNKRWGAVRLRRVESSCLPQTWPGFDFGPCYPYVGHWVCCLFSLCPGGRFFSGFPVFLPPQKPWTKNGITKFKFHQGRRPA